MTVAVLGSLNMDFVSQAARLPAPGETVRGHGFFTACGGKGANQAVAAARLGAQVRMIGQVGRDAFGATLRSSLAGEGVDVGAVAECADAHTGTAQIVVDDDGSNQIVVTPGANGRVGAEALAALEAALPDTRVLLLQLEVPLDTVVQAAELAARRGVTVVLDPAPAQALPDELLRTVRLLTPNETEIGRLVGFPVTGPQDAAMAARVLRARGAAGVLVTLGSRGGCYATAEGEGAWPPYPVRALDTVAAGDAFNGALATALAEGRPLAEAVDWAAAAGALAASRAGAQPSLPRRGEVEALRAAGRR